jgi:hypothetical protein
VKRDLAAGFYHGGAIAMGDYDAVSHLSLSESQEYVIVSTQTDG